MIENLHALSAHGNQFPGTLDLTGCSVFGVLEVHHLCVGEVFVQGDEGPVGGVAQGVHCHGVTVCHEEKKEEEIEQEVEGEKEEKRSNNNAHVHGWG